MKKNNILNGNVYPKWLFQKLIYMTQIDLNYLTSIKFGLSLSLNMLK